MENKVGKIKNIKLNEDTEQLELTIVITNNKFKKKLLRDFLLNGNLLIEKDNLIFIEKVEDAKI